LLEISEAVQGTHELIRLLVNCFNAG